MIFKRMREHILGKAIRGKLVPQLHEEGYVKQICNAPTNVPFAIPSTWKWCSLGNLVDYGKAEKISCNDIPSSTWVLELEDIEENTGKILEKKRDVEVKSNKNVFEEGYLLYSKLRPYLNKVVIADECGVCTTELIPINVKSAKAPLLPKYLQFFLMSPDFVDYANRHSHGAKPRLGTNDAKAANIPIPPFEEQNRIVAKIESLFGEIDRAEEAYEELQSLANVLRCQILQKAIQGKLVPQLPDDGVVEQIGDLPAELPFEIPDSWKWGLLENYVTINPSASKLDDNTEVSFLPMASVHPGFVNNFDREESKLWANAKKGFSKFANGDVLIAKISPCFENRKSCIVRDLINGFGAGSTELITMRPTDLIYAEYLLWYVKTKYVIDYCSSTFKGTVGQQRINPDRYKSMPIPVPPLAEQKRIVAKIETLLEQVDLMTK